MKLIFRRSATRDLKEIEEYLKRDSDKVAGETIANIVRACATLLEFPRKAHRYSDKYRCLVVGKHLVFYRLDGEAKTITVVRVLDGRRNVARLLK